MNQIQSDFGDGMLAPRRRRALVALHAYWRGAPSAIGALPMPEIAPPEREPLPPKLEQVTMPDWAQDLAPPGGLLTASHWVAPGAGAAWARTDWLAAAQWFLDATAERAWEDRHGPIHSFSWRLTGFDPRLWQHAWANRIARSAPVGDSLWRSEERLGPLPDAERSSRTTWMDRQDVAD